MESAKQKNLTALVLVLSMTTAIAQNCREYTLDQKPTIKQLKLT